MKPHPMPFRISGHLSTRFLKSTRSWSLLSYEPSHYRHCPSSRMHTIRGARASLVSHGRTPSWRYICFTCSASSGLTVSRIQYAFHLPALCSFFAESEKGRFLFVQMPPELAASKEKRKQVDASILPLTAHGEMMVALINSNISTYPHVAVRAQFFEAIGRYLEFFKVRKECMIPVLHALLDER